jgi:transcription initiation factor IIF auxiliary subunit
MSRLWRSRLTWIFGVWVLFFAMAAMGQSKLSAKNTARYQGEGQWEWTVFLEGPEADLDRIRTVEYLLHPTFEPRRVQSSERHAPGGPFAITRAGWGSFVIPITVTFKDGSQQSLSHELVLTPDQAESTASSLSVGNDAQQLGKRLWRWTVFIEAPEDTLSQIQCVTYTLHETFPDPVREVCARGRGSRAFPLTVTGWGTFELQARVYFKDGRVQDLTHDLRF